MASYNMTVTSPRAPAEVFAYLARFSNAAEWDPGVVSGCSLADEEGPRLGSVYRLVVRFGGREVPLDYEVVELVPSYRVVLRADNGLVRSTDTITVTSVPDGGCSVDYQAVLEAKKARAVLGPVLDWAFRRTGDRARAGLLAKLAA